MTTPAHSPNLTSGMGGSRCEDVSTVEWPFVAKPFPQSWISTWIGYD